MVLGQVEQLAVFHFPLPASIAYIANLPHPRGLGAT